MAISIPAVLPPGELTREQLVQALGACELCQGDGRVFAGYYPGADERDCWGCDSSGTRERWACAICAVEYSADEELPFNVSAPDADPDSLFCYEPGCVREGLAIDPQTMSGAAREWYEARQPVAIKTVVGREAS
jgi:hypothetical protein